MHLEPARRARASLWLEAASHLIIAAAPRLEECDMIVQVYRIKRAVCLFAIAIIELPGQAEILDASGDRVARPILYDGGAELGTEVTFAGYGSWGVGSLGGDGGVSVYYFNRRKRR